MVLLSLLIDIENKTGGLIFVASVSKLDALLRLCTNYFHIVKIKPSICQTRIQQNCNTYCLLNISCSRDSVYPIKHCLSIKQTTKASMLKLI